MTGLVFLIYSLSVWRVTHLVVDDQIPIVRRPRDWIVERWPDSNFAYFLNCTWCASVWIAAAHVGALYLIEDEVAGPVVLAASWSALTALYETIVQYLDAKMIPGD